MDRYFERKSYRGHLHRNIYCRTDRKLRRDIYLIPQEKVLEYYDHLPLQLVRRRRDFRMHATAMGTNLPQPNGMELWRYSLQIRRHCYITEYVREHILSNGDER